jgi:peptidoglycan-associated lipoprotein
MSTIRPVLALMVFILLVGCQAAKAPPGLAGTTGARERAAEVVAIEPPDAETPSARGLPPPPEQFVPAPRLADIYFDYDAHTIRPEDTGVLDENAAWLRTNPDALVLIEGHTDERGTSEYNLVLGDLRAAAAMGYLIAHGIPAGRLVAISYGKERPICAERSEACWARNRRVRFLMKPL